jgi:hypothetical protein
VLLEIDATVKVMRRHAAIGDRCRDDSPWRFEAQERPNAR